MIDIDHGNSSDAAVASPPFDTKKPQPSWLGLSRFRPDVAAPRQLCSPVHPHR